MSIKTTRRIKRTVCLLSALATAGWAASGMATGCESGNALKGVNLSGAEFNGTKLPGTLSKDYIYPNQAEFAYFSSIGMNAVRLPFRWERVQPTLFGELDAAELKDISDAVALAKAKGMCIILDVHNYGAYRGNVIGTEEVPVEAFIDLWTRLAAHFPDAGTVAFGLMNEPAKLPIEQWADAAQRTIVAIRKTGAKNLLLASGGRWSGVHEWEKTIGTTSNASAFANFKDPLNRTLLEVHQYADANYSGTGRTCVPVEKLSPMFDDITQWAKTNNQKLFLGEFGVPSGPECLAALDAILGHMQDTSVWRGWTYWAAGSWWGSYPFSIEPHNGQDAPQTAILKKYL